MSLICRVAACVLLAAVPAIAQKAPEFEVASIRPTPEGNAAAGVGLRITDSQVHITGLSLRDYIGMAYSLEPPQVIAPEWVAQQRFDISCNLPAGATREQVPQMLQVLLAERFQVKVHKESREFPIYALTVSKGGTGLTDRFDFSLDLSQEDYQFAMIRAPVNNGVSLPPQIVRVLETAPSNVLGPYIATIGLELEGRKAPLEVVVVDSASKTPTEN